MSEWLKEHAWKSLDQLLALLQALNCDVGLVMRLRHEVRRAPRPFIAVLRSLLTCAPHLLAVYGRFWQGQLPRQALPANRARYAKLADALL